MTKAVEPSSPAATPHQFFWRRMLQYRLRTLLVLTTAIAVGLGWWTHKVRQQREAVGALRQINATISYDFQTRMLKGPPHWPAWLVNALGVDYFANVTAVRLPSYASDGGLTRLTAMTQLKSLDLNRTRITDAGLEELNYLTNLRELYLSFTEVTDAGLPRLKVVPTLNELHLRGTQVTDVGLESLGGAMNLRELDLTGTQVTDNGVARLQKALPNCKIGR